MKNRTRLVRNWSLLALAATAATPLACNKDNGQGANAPQGSYSASAGMNQPPPGYPQQGYPQQGYPQQGYPQIAQQGYPQPQGIFSSSSPLPPAAAAAGTRAAARLILQQPGYAPQPGPQPGPAPAASASSMAPARLGDHDRSEPAPAALRTWRAGGLNAMLQQPGAVPGDLVEAGIKAIALAHAQGMQPEGQIAKGNLQQGGHLEFMVPMQAGKCYTLVGFSPPGQVRNMDLNLLAPPFYNVLAGQDTTEDNHPIIGKTPNPMCPAIPLPINYKVMTSSRAPARARWASSSTRSPSEDGYVETSMRASG